MTPKLKYVAYCSWLTLVPLVVAIYEQVLSRKKWPEYGMWSVTVCQPSQESNTVAHTLDIGVCWAALALSAVRVVFAIAIMDYHRTRCLFIWRTCSQCRQACISWLYHVHVGTGTFMSHLNQHFVTVFSANPPANQSVTRTSKPKQSWILWGVSISPTAHEHFAPKWMKCRLRKCLRLLYL